MSAVKDWWSNLFDNSLESIVFENEQFRNLTMIFHILQLEFQKTNAIYFDLQQTIEDQAKELQQLKSSNKSVDTKMEFRSPLRLIAINEVTPVKKVQDTSVNLEEDADIFNHQISELDLMNSSKENDSTMFIDDSFNQFEITNSPKLNKSKRHSRNIRDRSRLKILENTIICNTPVAAKDKKVKKYKQSKLSLTQLTGRNCTKKNKENLLTEISIIENKSCTNKSNYEAIQQGKSSILDENKRIHSMVEHSNGHKNITTTDDDATLCLAAKHAEHIGIEVILNQLENDALPNKRKKPILDNSFDRIPDKFSDDEDFVYKPEVVRKKAERLKLKGWSCQECEKYYTNLNLDEKELKKKMDNCSRHRSKFNPRILTPEGFWNPEFSPTQDESSIAFEL